MTRSVWRKRVKVIGLVLSVMMLNLWPVYQASFGCTPSKMSVAKIATAIRKNSQRDCRCIMAINPTTVEQHTLYQYRLSGRERIDAPGAQSYRYVHSVHVYADRCTRLDSEGLSACYRPNIDPETLSRYNDLRESVNRLSGTTHDPQDHHRGANAGSGGNLCSQLA